jgi:glucose-6-phosphate isomerase
MTHSTLRQQNIKDFIHTKHINFFYGFSNFNHSNLDNHLPELIEQYTNLKNKTYINQTENRAITHHQLRKDHEINNLLSDIQSIESQLPDHITTICHIGIGGSIVGPKFIDHILDTWQTPKKRNTIFISSHDEEHIAKKLDQVSINKTVFIMVSKSGKTIEIEKTINEICRLKNTEKTTLLKNQAIAITTKGSAFKESDFKNTLYFDEGVGGRFSTTSQVGMITIGLCYGELSVSSILLGAKEADENAASLTNNIAATQAIIRFEQLKQFSGLSIVPYGESLVELIPFTSQLICESLGKGAFISNQQSLNQHAPILMTGSGPDAQHTFFQQLHQGHPIIPVEFYMVAPTQRNQNHLLEQIIGQSISLFEGQHHNNPHHHFEGNRPSTITLIKKKTSEAIGFLIAMIENRIMFEGFLHNINAFDQPGVELGKQMTKQQTKPNSIGNQLFNKLTSL